MNSTPVLNEILIEGFDKEVSKILSNSYSDRRLKNRLLTAVKKAYRRAVKIEEENSRDRAAEKAERVWNKWLDAKSSQRLLYITVGKFPGACYDHFVPFGTKLIQIFKYMYPGCPTEEWLASVDHVKLVGLHTRIKVDGCIVSFIRKNLCRWYAS